ncbi:MAG: hypothetical protein QM621_04275 [Aeromicrobium sp.]|uniref:bestrophin-like domain n=1 Tax=Aeromicrobium sp. TaxID=1871063 RepID=UPI0039E6AE98
MAAIGRPRLRRWLVRRWHRTRTITTVWLAMIVVLALHLAVSWLAHLLPEWQTSETLTGAAYFVFGLFAAFTLENARVASGRVQELLKAGDADIVTLYELSAAFGPDCRDELRVLLDEHLQDQIDFRLVDFDQSTGSFLRIFDQLRDLEPAGSAQEIVYGQMLATWSQSGERRKQIEALIRQHVSGIEWFVLLSLFVSLWGLMLAPSAGVVTTVLGGVLMAALAAVLVVLKHIDDLRWQESQAIWLPLHRLFRTLDLDPYYPGLVLESKRLVPPAGQVRVAQYDSPYPDMTDKEIVVARVDGRGKVDYEPGE